MGSTVTLAENNLIRRQYDPCVVKVATFDTPVTIQKGDTTLCGPAPTSLAALDQMLANTPSLRIRRVGPGEYIFWHRAKS